MISAKRLELLRPHLDSTDHSAEEGFWDVPDCPIDMYELFDTLSAALKVVEVVQGMIEAKQIALNEVWTGGLGPKLKEALAPFAEEKEKE